MGARMSRQGLRGISNRARFVRLRSTLLMCVACLRIPRDSDAGACFATSHGELGKT